MSFWMPLVSNRNREEAGEGRPSCALEHYKYSNHVRDPFGLWML